MKEFSRVPQVSFLEDRIRIADVRDFSWSKDGIVKTRWITRTIAREDLKSAYLVTEQFRKWGASHVFLCFETDLDPICVSIEARRLEGQKYSIWRGMLSHYELIYLYGTARDLIAERIDRKERELDIAKLTLSDDERWALFSTIAREAEENAKEPKRYHTIRRNCSTQLARAFPDIRAPILPKNLGFILMSKNIAEPYEIYDAENRPPFL